MALKSNGYHTPGLSSDITSIHSTGCSLPKTYLVPVSEETDILISLTASLGSSSLQLTARNAVIRRNGIIISLFIFVIFLVFGYKKAQTIAIRFTVHHKPSSNMGCLRPYGCSPNIDDMLFLLAVVIVKLLSNMSWTRVSPIRIQKYKISLKDRRNYPNLSSNVSTL